VCQSATSFEDIDTARLRYPCVVKPALSLVGKSGVRVVKATDGLASAFREALKASINGVVNVEELVPGRNVALMAVVHEGRLSPITLFDELNSTDDGGSLRGVARVVPSVFSGRPEEERIVALGQKVVDQFGLDTTAFVMSCRCSQGGRPKLIEVHLEIGGDLVHDVLLPASTSFDVLAYVIQTLAGDSRHHETIEFRPAAVIFGQGEGLVSERPYDVLTAPSRAALERTLEAKQVFADA
jgi:biotin carboxylase